MQNRLNKAVIPFLVLAVLALLFAMWGGLMRLGWRIPALSSSMALAHGPLMITGFLGILITVERAVALKQRWMYAPAVFAAIGWVIILTGWNAVFGAALMSLASAGGVMILIEITRREPALYTGTMLLGSLSWLVGNILWLMGWQIYQVVFFWQAFLVLTIAGERLELSRVLRPTENSMRLFAVILIAYLLSLVAFPFNLQVGSRLNGGALFALALWSFRNDIAWRNLRHSLPLTRYIAWCLAIGFVWLGIGGALGMGFGAQVAGPRYDAALHTIFVGFVISMIFGHAPIIFPAVLGVPVLFRPAFYFHLIILNASLAIRVIGDFINIHPMRMWGGLLNEAAILLFLVMTVSSVIGSVRRSATSS